MTVLRTGPGRPATQGSSGSSPAAKSLRKQQQQQPAWPGAALCLPLRHTFGAWLRGAASASSPGSVTQCLRPSPAAAPAAACRLSQHRQQQWRCRGGAGGSTGLVVPERACCSAAKAIHRQQRGTGGSRQCWRQGVHVACMHMPSLDLHKVLLVMRVWLQYHHDKDGNRLHSKADCSGLQQVDSLLQ